MPHKKIVAIGGGSKPRSTRPIDEEIVRLSGKKHPHMLFIPTASSDDERYWEGMDKYYTELGCKTDVLFLIKEKPTHKNIQEKILNSDIIYVGGGNTLMMMKLWRKLGVDKLLKKAWEQGTVMCGASAGSICWFDSGHSDSMSYYNPKKWEYINVKALGFLKGIHCPHYDSETLGIKRKKNFQTMIQKIGGMGIAIDNDCAIAYLDDEVRVLSSKPSAKAYRVYKKKGKVVSEVI